MRHPFAATILLYLLFAPYAWAEAVTLAQCDRLTNPAHAGQSDHRDLGEGRVMWTDWWSLEGTATDITLMDCDSGDALTFRTAETNMTRGRTSFDRTDIALEIIAYHEQGARVFATFDRIAADLEKSVRDMAQTTRTEESCACAALYPDLRGAKAGFVLTIVGSNGLVD